MREAVDDLVLHRLAGLEVGEEPRDLLLDGLSGGKRLVVAVLLAAGRAVVARLVLTASDRPVHASAAAVAAHDAAQQIAIRRAARVLGGGALATQAGAAVEQLLADDRLVLAADLLARAALRRDVAAVGQVAEHVADGVGAEQVAARGPLAALVEPKSDVPVRVAAGGVDLEDGEHERRALGVGDGDAVIALEVAPRQAAGQEPLARLLLEADRRPERERHGVVFVEDLVDRLGQEGGRVVDVAERLGDRDVLDAQLRTQQLLVVLGLDRVPREPRRVEDQHRVELVRAGVADEALEVVALLDAAPALQVHVLVDELEAVLVGVGLDRLSLSVWREALALLLGRLADLGDGAALRDRSVTRRARVSRRQGDYPRFFSHASS